MHIIRDDFSGKLLKRCTYLKSFWKEYILEKLFQSLKESTCWPKCWSHCSPKLYFYSCCCQCHLPIDMEKNNLQVSKKIIYTGLFLLKNHFSSSKKKKKKNILEVKAKCEYLKTNFSLNQAGAYFFWENKGRCN